MTDIQSTLSTAILNLRKTSESASLDAEVLLSHVLSKPRSHLRAWPEKKISEQEHKHFQQLFKKRQQGFPIAYIVEHREFWSREFKVNPDVLIPRPDTELLIELSLNLMTNKANPRILDLGTGSGIIAITLAAERPDIDAIATDLSYDALKIAQENANNHNISNIHFIHANWLAGIAQVPFDLIISNPPYIPQNDTHLSEGDVRFEPKTALIAAEHGLKDIKIISQQARTFLKTDATLLVEHGFDQQTAVQKIFKSFGYSNITPFSDLSANPRVTTGQWHTL